MRQSKTLILSTNIYKKLETEFSISICRPTQKANGFLKGLKTKTILSFLHFMINWTELSELFQQKFSLVAEVKQRIDELEKKYEHMKTRRSKTLRQFQKESANGSFKGVIITQQVQRRVEDDNKKY